LGFALFSVILLSSTEFIHRILTNFVVGYILISNHYHQ